MKSDGSGSGAGWTDSSIEDSAAGLDFAQHFRATIARTAKSFMRGTVGDACSK
jgi:hypothetical protein